MTGRLEFSVSEPALGAARRDHVRDHSVRNVPTVISLIAWVAGFTALAKCREIGLATAPGRTYVLLTIASCVSGLFIFRDGTFVVPHAIAVLTLIVLILAIAAEKRAIFGRLSRYVSVVGYSATLFRSGSAGVARGRRRRVPGVPDRRGTAGAAHPA